MNFSAARAASLPRRREKNWRLVWLAGLIALASAHAAPSDLDSFHRAPALYSRHRDGRPDNVFACPAKLPLDFRRVAVLPLAAGAGGGDLADGCSTLAPVLFEQLVKTKRFETIAVDPADLQQATGRRAWTGTETLPSDFLAFLRREYGCDGVLFAELTSFRAYTPLAVGWRLKLVDARSGQILWAADELFDANQPAVRRAAQHFGVKGFRWPFCPEENWLPLNSPRQFGRYSAAALLETLPER